jgi:sulfur-carrier protein
MRIRVTVPGLLADSVGGAREFFIEAATLEEALSAVRRDQTILSTHIWDDAGHRRQHVLIYLNDQSIEWSPDSQTPLRDGDQLHFIQAVSGGAEG